MPRDDESKDERVFVCCAHCEFTPQTILFTYKKNTNIKSSKVLFECDRNRCDECVARRNLEFKSQD